MKPVPITPLSPPADETAPVDSAPSDSAAGESGGRRSAASLAIQRALSVQTGPSDLAVTRETILVHARQLPAAPRIMNGLCTLLQDVRTNLDELADQIRLEPTLSAKVIQLSNNAVFGGGTRVGSINEAVNRVGFGEVLRLVGAATVAGLVDRALGCYAVSAERLRESLLFHALASEALAGYAHIDSRSAYSAGLVRGIGTMVLDRVGRLRVTGTHAFDPQKFTVYGEWERARFGMSGLEATSTVLEEWRFPADLVKALREHLMLEESDFENPFACVLNLAGAVVAEHCLALPGDAACWEVTPAKLAAIDIDEEQFRKAAQRAATLFEQQRKALY